MATVFTDAASFRGASLTSVGQLTREGVELVCATATVMRGIVDRKGGCDVLRHRVLANVFYEPSTRTSSSFAAAMQRLGGSVLQINESTSSAAKGETLGDSMRALACYSDVIVLRHPAQGSAAEAAAAVAVPVLNAGDGVGEHPTQALLDYATLRGELPGVPLGELTVAMVGDLKHGRTVHSLAKLLALCGVGRVVYVAPPELAMPSELQAALASAGVAQLSVDTLEEALPLADVVYVTRVQRERFADASTYERLRLAFVLTAHSMRAAKARCVVMHPLPRTGEIAEDVDADPRAAYFRQMRYGLHVRMALLALALGIAPEQLAHE